MQRIGGDQAGAASEGQVTEGLVDPLQKADLYFKCNEKNHWGTLSKRVMRSDCY